MNSFDFFLHVTTRNANYLVQAQVQVQTDPEGVYSFLIFVLRFFRLLFELVENDLLHENVARRHLNIDTHSITLPQ